MFTGQRSGSASNIFKIVKGITLHWAPVSIFLWNRNPIRGQSYWPVRVFILDLVNICRILNTNSFNKKFIVALIGVFLRFVLFNFMYLLATRGQQTLKWLLLLQTWQTFPQAGHLPRGCKFTLFYKVSFVLVVSVMIRLIQFLCAAWPALIALDRVRSHSRRSLSQSELSLVPHTIISLTRKPWRLSNSHSEFNFFNSVTKSWKFWPPCCLHVKNLWRRMVIFFLGLQYYLVE